jgi:hypothetical protein
MPTPLRLHFWTRIMTSERTPWFLAPTKLSEHRSTTKQQTAVFLLCASLTWVVCLRSCSSITDEFILPKPLSPMELDQRSKSRVFNANRLTLLMPETRKSGPTADSKSTAALPVKTARISEGFDLSQRSILKQSQRANILLLWVAAIDLHSFINWSNLYPMLPIL